MYIITLCLDIVGPPMASHLAPHDGGTSLQWMFHVFVLLIESINHRINHNFQSKTSFIHVYSEFMSIHVFFLIHVYVSIYIAVCCHQIAPQKIGDPGCKLWRPLSQLAPTRSIL